MAHHRRDIDFNNNSRRHANSSNTCPSTFAQEAFVVTIEESLTARKSLLSELETTLQEILSRIEVAGVARRRIIAPRINQIRFHFPVSHVNQKDFFFNLTRASYHFDVIRVLLDKGYTSGQFEHFFKAHPINNLPTIPVHSTCQASLKGSTSSSSENLITFSSTDSRSDECKVSSEFGFVVDPDVLPPAPQIEINAEIKCIYNDIADPQNIYLLPCTWENKLHELNDRLEEFYRKNCSKLTPVSPRENILGGIFAVEWRSDSSFYRGQILSVQKNCAKVLFIDYGNEDKVTYNKIFPLDKRLTGEPPLTIKCRLNGLDNQNFVSKWKQEYKTFFENLICAPQFGDCILCPRFVDRKELDSSVYRFEYCITLLANEYPPIDVSEEMTNLMFPKKCQEINSSELLQYKSRNPAGHSAILSDVSNHEMRIQTWQNIETNLF